jgi:hypothetical protein
LVVQNIFVPKMAAARDFGEIKNKNTGEQSYGRYDTI